MESRRDEPGYLLVFTARWLTCAAGLTAFCREPELVQINQRRPRHDA